MLSFIRAAVVMVSPHSNRNPKAKMNSLSLSLSVLECLMRMEQDHRKGHCNKYFRNCTKTQEGRNKWFS
jgi:hypothetical protein